MQQEQWLPLTEYALRTGISISTLRRKIKSNAVEYKMDDGRYLVRCDKFLDDNSFHSTDAADPSPNSQGGDLTVAALERRMAEGELRWRAMDARVAGLARRLDMFSEQISEIKMLVKIFEEKLDNER